MQRHNFVPTTSALDYATSGQSRQSLVQGLFQNQNVLYNIASDSEAQRRARTPFDDFYLPGVTISDNLNQEHVSAEDPTIGTFFVQQLTLPIPDRSTPPPSTLTAGFYGPTTLNHGQEGTWTVQGFEGAPPYSYVWEYYYDCAPPPPECTGNLCSSAPNPGGPGDDPFGPSPAPGGNSLVPPDPGQCDVWNGGGSDYAFSETFHVTPAVQIHARVYDASGAMVVVGHEIAVQHNVAGGESNATTAVPEGDGNPIFAAVTTELPTAFALADPRPNPFTTGTVVAFDLPELAAVRLAVYDVLGREVAVLAEGGLEAGRYTLVFDGQRLPAGVYVVRLQAGAFTASRRMTLAR